MYSIHNQWTRRYAKRVLGGLILALFMTAGCAMTENRIKKEREADSHYKLGMAHLNENNLQMAFIEFQKAIEFNPGDKTYYYAIGIVDFKMDRLEDAIDAYKKALTIDPVYAEAHNGLGAIYGKLGKWDDAIHEYKKALENRQYSTPQWVHYNIGYAYFNKGDYPPALLAFKEAVKFQPDMSMFHLWLGFTYMKLEMTKEAIDAYEAAKRLDAKNMDIYYNLGFAYLKEGMRSKALDAFKKVVELSPESDAAADSMKYIDLLKK